MKKYIPIEVKKYNCTGLYLQVDDNFKEELKTSTQVNRYLKDNKQIKIQLRIKIDNKRGKKNYSILYSDVLKGMYIDKTTKEEKYYAENIQDIIAIAESKRLELKDKIKKGESLKEIKKEEDIKLNDNPTFLEVVEDFLKFKEVSLRENTLIAYRSQLLFNCKELHHLDFESITTKDIQNLIYKRKQEGKKPASIKLLIIAIGLIFKNNKKLNRLVELDLIDIPEVNNKRDYNLPIEDTKRIIKELREYSKINLENGDVFYKYEEIKNIFAFSLTGRRIGEILKLRFCDLNFDTNTFKIITTNAKGKKELEFMFDDYLIEALKSQARLRNIDLYSKSEDKIFTYVVQTVLFHFRKILEKLNLPATLRTHDIRHILATTLVQNKVAIQDISRMLGHSSIAITEKRYATTNKEQANRAVNAFNSLMDI